MTDQTTDCPACDGRGFYDGSGEICGLCHGAGETDSVVSHEPASGDTQAALCVTGETQHQSTTPAPGENSPDGLGDAGDEELGALHCLGMCADWEGHPAYQGEDDAGLRQFLIDCAEGLRWQRDEIERLRAEVSSLRLTLSGRTYSPDVPEPIGCPMPGACAQVAEIGRLRNVIRVNALRYDPSATHEQIDEVIYGKR